MVGTHDHFREIFLDPKLGEMVTKLACVGGMRIWHDQTLIKEPWAPPSSTSATQSPRCL
jgi:hypothetical protein